METPKILLFEVREHVAHITLNRPEVSNAMNLEMAREFYEAASECEQRSDLRAVLITGAGRAFCSGGDVKSFAAQESSRLPAYYRRITLFLHQAIHRLARMRAPVVMAVNGTAGGGGMSLACAGDIVLASESARFTMAYTQIGLTPDGSSTYYLPRIIGLRRTLELALTNRVLNAREAETIGLVTRVIPDDQLMAHAQTLVAELAKGPTQAYGGVKRLLYTATNTSLAEQMELETEWLTEMAGTTDVQEGIAAFLAKRPPQFSGR
jgi:2-(1,2-epoxy-1,2-dihydrophenyl)acetyl-CoA isomerase